MIVQIGPETLPAMVVYQFGERQGRYDYWPLLVGEVRCLCGNRYSEHPQRFYQVDTDAAFGGWALGCECGMRYYPIKLETTITGQTFDFFKRAGVALAGTVRVSGEQFLIFTAPNIGEADFLALDWPASWGPGNTFDARLYCADDERLFAVHIGHLVVVYAAETDAGYAELVRLLV